MDEDNEHIEEVEMYRWECCACGVVMMMPESFNGSLRTSHSTFYCLNGHPQVYNKKTEKEELEGKLANEYAKNAQLEGEIKKLKSSVINRIFKP